MFYKIKDNIKIIHNVYHWEYKYLCAICCVSELFITDITIQYIYNFNSILSHIKNTIVINFKEKGCKYFIQYFFNFIFQVYVL